MLTFLTPLCILAAPITIASLLVWGERRLLALFQERHGPNRLGPLGLGQLPADVLKMFFKQDWVPPFADQAIFILAPAIIMATTLLSFGVIPLAPNWVVWDSENGLLVFFALSSLGAYSVVLAGWSSNNKYALLGGLRASGQMLAYEVFMGLSAMGVAARAGSFNLTKIVESQQGCWNIIPQILGFFIFYIAALAETHRTPFDLAEAESELVAGFHTEYSGLKFGMFFVGEYIGLTSMSAMMTLLFLGGWKGPWLPPALWFFLKTVFLIGTFILVRATLPRLRYDQLIILGWKYLMPLALLNLFATAGVLVCSAS
ncbi:MAG: NADH-quinone oxidoreductase subunit NuoH [Myxococcaceae bacterium]|nr:NADH-quinone oxidoreductase subunit NuoH [Myxococcaceae bacterium]MBH2006441.1 NADH-quinone oxidoreductase subunit NuoH [Myxococcaceae bacterium]